MLPYLPPEIIRMIIRLSFRPISTEVFGNDLERHRNLCNYALVDRSWRGIAQAELFDSVRIMSATREAKLFAGVGTDRQDLLRGIRSVRFEKAASAEDLSATWGLCSGVVEIGVRYEVLQYGLVNTLPVLRSLYLCGVSLPAPGLVTIPLVFPHLVHLTLGDVEEYQYPAATGWSAFLSPSSMPALRSLAVWEYGTPPRGWTQMLDPIASVGPQLLTFALLDGDEDRELERAFDSRLINFTALQHLVIGGGQISSKVRELHESYPLISSSLPSLEIVPFCHGIHNPHCTLVRLVASLRSNARMWRGIKRIAIPALLPAYQDNLTLEGMSPETTAAEEMATMTELRALAVARNFVLDETGIGGVWAHRSSEWEDFYL